MNEEPALIDYDARVYREELNVCFDFNAQTTHCNIPLPTEKYYLIVTLTDCFIARPNINPCFDHNNVLSFTTKKVKLFIITQVAKHGSTQKFVDTPVGSLCGECGELVTGIYCDTCNQRSLTCSVCRGHVMGLSVTCPKCGHGGHLKHFREWFTSRDYCPTNCSCNCALFLFPKS